MKFKTKKNKENKKFEETKILMYLYKEKLRNVYQIVLGER